MTFAHLTLATRDVRKTCDFFEATFAWKPINKPDNIVIKAAWLEIAPHQQLHLLHVPQFEPSPYEKEFGRHLALFHPLADFAALKDRLVEHGAELIDPLRAASVERFFFRDPNGYVFEVVDSAAA